MLEVTDAIEKIAVEEKAIVYFTATWCQPCKMIKPHFIKLANEDEQRNYFIVDVDTIDNSWLEKYNIKSVPRILVLENGEKTDELLSRKYLELKAEVDALKGNNK